LLTAVEEAILRVDCPDVTTLRGRPNHHYVRRAIAVLLDDTRFSWLLPGEADAARGAKLRFAIMAELGRIEDREELKAVASRLCELKPLSKPAVAMIRQWRRGKPAPTGILALTCALERCINDYLATHPSTTWEMVKAALDSTMVAVEEAASKSKQP